MRLTAPLLVLCALLVAGPAAASNGETAIIDKSLKVLTEVQAMPDLQVPDWLLQRAEGIAILPEVVKAGAIVGGRGGTGVLLVRHRDGSWSNPLFVGIGAGSFGWQFGVQAADIVLVFTTRKSVEGITDGKITLGGDASAVAGPVGRSASAATSMTFDAEVYSYSRAKGLFAGLSVEGSVLFIRDAANQRFYGKDQVVASDIIAETAPVAPPPAPALIDEVARITAVPPPAPAQPAAPSPGAPTPSQPAPVTAPSEAQTYPMADPAPGAEPN
jgi:lipid-binding SYLF domain-containing protein